MIISILKKITFITFISFSLYSPSIAQNLVTNPSFETVSAEPYWGCEITNATGWLNPAGSPCPANLMATPDLFSYFSTGQAILPNSFMGTTQPHTGDRCAGLVTYHLQLAEYREYLMTQFNCPLTPGTTYNISFWTTGGSPVQYIYHSNNMGIYFSTSALTQSGYNIISGITPQLELTSVISNSAWTYYTFSFTPTQAYTYMSIGNFRTDANTQIQTFGSNRPYAYYFFDDISVTPTTTPLSLGNDTTYCGNFSRTLVTGDASTVWSTGTTGSQITVTTPGTYSASYSSGCGVVNDTINIYQISPPPTFSLGNDTAYCGSFSQVLSTGNPNAIWSTGVTSGQITVNTAGTYWASVSNVCGTVSDSISIATNNLLGVNLGPDSVLCNGQSIQLDATQINSNYLWQDATTSATYNVTSAGVYSVTVTSSNGCVGKDSVTIGYTASAPSFTLGGDTAYCGIFSRTIDAGGQNALWSTGVSGYQIVVNNPGVYWAENSNACGAFRDSIVLSQIVPPAVELGVGSSICNGDSTLLQPVTTASNLLWSTGQITNTIYASAPGVYWVEVWDTVNCRSRDTVVINSGIPPVLNLGSDTSVCGNGLLLTLSNTNAQYVWQDNSIDSFYFVSGSGVYSVTASNSCGSSTDQINVEVHSDECALAIPTAFSPNGDGKNDVFRAISYCSTGRFLMRVYNRWGELVFESTTISEGWNGTYRNTAQPVSVFVYYIEYYNECSEAMKKVVGNVSLIR
ncbi:MAG: gliding motility-associated C-terminal domain-containing protein [Chitinophagales bacterium]